MLFCERHCGHTLATRDLCRRRLLLESEMHSEAAATVGVLCGGSAARTWTAACGADKHGALLGWRFGNACTTARCLMKDPFHEVLGYPDHLKFHSSMTPFARAEPGKPVFQAALQKIFAGNFDQSTLNRLC
jgi:Protein of unknown function (DUF1810)